MKNFKNKTHRAWRDIPKPDDRKSWVKENKSKEAQKWKFH